MQQNNHLSIHKAKCALNEIKKNKMITSSFMYISEARWNSLLPFPCRRFVMLCYHVSLPPSHLPLNNSSLETTKFCCGCQCQKLMQIGIDGSVPTPVGNKTRRHGELSIPALGSRKAEGGQRLTKQRHISNALKPLWLCHLPRFCSKPGLDPGTLGHTILQAEERHAARGVLN